jgi:hypothetical protein
MHGLAPSAGKPDRDAQQFDRFALNTKRSLCEIPGQTNPYSGFEVHQSNLLKNG